MSGPLKGIKVVDLSRILAGPWATQCLADFGADVIKIEQPQKGDDTRHWGPPFVTRGNSQDAAYFLSANRGKTSLAIDFTTEAGQRQIIELVMGADVLVENFKVGGLKKYGLDFDSLKKINPRLVYCSITGFGQTGPYASQPGYDAIIQGMGGLMSITGIPEGEAGAGPQKVGVAVADLMTGMYAVSAILAALIHVSKTGEGQQIDLALFDTQVAWLANQNLNYLVTGEPPKACGTSHPNIVPYQAFKASDQHFMLAVGNDRQFSDFCHVIGKMNWAKQPRFKTNANRVENKKELVSLVSEILESKPAAYWINACQSMNIPAGPINNLKQVFQDPQIKAREMLFELKDDDGHAIPQVANPVKFSLTPICYSKSPPKLTQEDK